MWLELSSFQRIMTDKYCKQLVGLKVSITSFCIVKKSLFSFNINFVPMLLWCKSWSIKRCPTTCSTQTVMSQDPKKEEHPWNHSFAGANMWSWGGRHTASIACKTCRWLSFSRSSNQHCYFLPYFPSLKSAYLALLTFISLSKL